MSKLRNTVFENILSVFKVKINKDLERIFKCTRKVDKEFSRAS